MKIFYKIFYEISYHTFWNIDPEKSKIFSILYDLLWLIESTFILFLKKIYVYNIFVYNIFLKYLMKVNSRSHFRMSILKTIQNK